MVNSSFAVANKEGDIPAAVSAAVILKKSRLLSAMVISL